jgi:FMN phosphatase YigB (HAD superfamily)
MPTASFDVFDTLLTRIWAEPRDLFVRLGEKLRDAGLCALEPMQFAAERREAEQRARAAKPTREVMLTDIVQELGQRLSWTATQCAAVEAAEIALEDESIRAVPAMWAVVAQARREVGQVIFLTDMYLPSAVIRRWLERGGFFQDGDLLLVSGEVGAGKGTGELFRQARAATSGDFRTWIHRGDHPVSDDESPHRLGIVTQPARAAQLSRHERTLRGADRFATPGRSFLAGAARRARLAGPDESTDERKRILWEIGATVTGPLFWSFTDWCLREAERRGVQELYFLSRGGQIFLRIAEAIQAVRPARVRCHYLLTSRLAFAGAADAHNLDYLRWLAASSLAFHSVRQALTNLGVEHNAACTPPQPPPAEWDRNLAPAERTALADWLLAPARLPQVQAALTERGQRARAYLAQSGLRSGISAGVVDTGWSGTIQRNLEFLLGVPGQPTPLTGFYLGLSPGREITCAGETLAYTNAYGRLALRRETTHLILLELMARATEGALLGFAEREDRIEPRLGPIDAATVAEVTLFQNAVLAFVRCLLEVAPDHTMPDDALARTTIGGYRDFFLQPSVSEAQVFGRMPHADQMLEHRHTVLCPEMTLGQILTAIGDFHRRPPGWWLAGQATLGHAPVIRAYIALKRLKWFVQTRATGQPD